MGFRFEVRPVTDRVQITAAKTQVARLGPVSVLTCNAGREGGGGILQRRAHSRLVGGSSPPGSTTHSRSNGDFLVFGE